MALPFVFDSFEAARLALEHLSAAGLRVDYIDIEADRHGIAQAGNSERCIVRFGVPADQERRVLELLFVGPNPNVRG